MYSDFCTQDKKGLMILKYFNLLEPDFSCVGVVLTQGHYFIPATTGSICLWFQWFEKIGVVENWNEMHWVHSETLLIGSYQVGAVLGFWKRSDLAAVLVLFTVRCLAQANIPLFSVCFLFPWLRHSCLFQSHCNSQCNSGILFACGVPSSPFIKVFAQLLASEPLNFGVARKKRT